MKRKKLNLEALKVSSFVTRPGQQNTRTYKGGTQVAIPIVNPLEISNGSRSALDYCCYPDSGVHSCAHLCGTEEYTACHVWENSRAEACTKPLITTVIPIG